MSAILPHPNTYVASFGSSLRITAFAGEIFDRLIYEGLDEGVPVMVHEYAPMGLVTRLDDGGLAVAQPQFEAMFSEARERFLTMAEAWKDASGKAAGGPHLAKVRSIKTEGDSIWVVTDHPGQRLVDAGAADPRQAAGGLATALNAMFKAGLTLGNICPETVYQRDGRVVFAGPSPDSRDLINGLGTDAYAGAIGYSAPEMFDGMKRAPIGQEADLFAATALIFRLYTQRDPVDLRKQDLDADVALAVASLEGHADPAKAALTLGLAISRKVRGDNIRAWFEGLLASVPKVEPAVKVPPVEVQAVAAQAAPLPEPVIPSMPDVGPDLGPEAAKANTPQIGYMIAGGVAALAIVLLMLNLGGIKDVLANGKKGAETAAVERCKSEFSSNPAGAQAVCVKARDKISDSSSQAFYDVNYDLGSLCETRHACEPGKAPVDYYTLAAGDKTSVTGRIANYKVAKLSPGLSPPEALDFYAPAGGNAAKVDAAFAQSNKDIYADANYQLGLIFETWSQKSDYDPEETKRLSGGKSRSLTRIAMLSASHRFEVAKVLGIDTTSRLTDLYLRLGDDDVAASQYESALAYYQKAATLGNAEASFKAADLFFSGSATSIDQPQALDLVYSAAAADNVDALYCLTGMYYYGYPYAKDQDKVDAYLGRIKSLDGSDFNQLHYDNLGCSRWISNHVG